MINKLFVTRNGTLLYRLGHAVATLLLRRGQPLHARARTLVLNQSSTMTARLFSLLIRRHNNTVLLRSSQMAQCLTFLTNMNLYLTVLRIQSMLHSFTLTRRRNPSGIYSQRWVALSLSWSNARYFFSVTTIRQQK